MSKIKLNLLILLALIGIGLSAYLTYQHFHILIHGVKENSFCSFNEKFDCDSVGMSEYAKIGPFPVAGLGLLYFVYLLGALLYARFIPDASRKCLTLPFLLTLPGIALCLYLIYVSSFILKTYCIFCMGLSTMTLLTVILLPTAMGLSFTEIGSYFINSIKNIFKIGSGNIIYALAVGGLGLLLLGGYESKYAADFEDFDQKAYLDFFYLQKPIELNPTGRPLWGKENAPVTIVEFSDFECPFCKRAALNFKPRLKEFQDQVAFYFVNYPLDQSCNPEMKRELHKNACFAAKAALCANDQQKFWPMHDQLFANQPNFSTEQLMSYAQAAGVDIQKLKPCIESEETQKKILSDLELGKTARLQGTPYILINGRPMKEWMNPVMVNLIIREELKRAKK